MFTFYEKEEETLENTLSNDAEIVILQMQNFDFSGVLETLKKKGHSNDDSLIYVVTFKRKENERI